MVTSKFRAAKSNCLPLVPCNIPTQAHKGRHTAAAQREKAGSYPVVACVMKTRGLSGSWLASSIGRPNGIEGHTGRISELTVMLRRAALCIRGTRIFLWVGGGRGDRHETRCPRGHLAWPPRRPPAACVQDLA